MSGHKDSAQGAEESYPTLWKNQDFLRFFFGQFVSNVGDSLYNVAILWLVLELSGSIFLTGVANSLLLLPFLLQIVAGPIVDRFPIKPVLVGSQVVQGVVILVLPIAAYTGNLTVELILVTIPALSLMTLVVSPVQATLVPRIVADDQLSRSNSVLATVTLGLDMVFDALGGIFIAVFGATTLFFLDSLTFAIAGVLFFGMLIPTVEDGSEESTESAISDYVTDLRAGIDILRGTVFVDMMFISAVSNFAVGVTLTILPAFGDLLGGPAVYGLLLGALGIGRLVGSASASYLNDVSYGRLMTVIYLLAALCWLGSVYSPSLVLTIGLFGLAWIPGGIDGVLTATLNQKVFPSSLLGRVSAIKGTAVGATLPLGSLVGGLIAEQLGTVTTMGLAASGFGFVGLWFALRPSLRDLPAMSDVDPTEFNIHDTSSSSPGNSN
jgi:MFS family permease